MGITNGYNLFVNNQLLTDLEIPSDITEIQREAFAGCISIASLTIPKSVTKIGGESFLGCESLKSLIIDNAETLEIEPLSFMGSGLEKITLKNNTPPICVIGIHEDTYNGNTEYTPFSIDREKGNNSDYIFKNCTLYVPAAAKQAYQEAEVWKRFEYIKTNGFNIDIYRGNDTAESDIVDIDGLENLVINNNDLVFVDDVDLTIGKDNYVVKDNNGEWVAAKIALTDAEPFYCPAEVAAETLSYTRNFSGDFWQALYIPFDMSFEEWTDVATVAYFNNVHQYDIDGDGEPDKTTIEFFTQKRGSLSPNIPYMIKPRKTGEVTFVCSNKTLAATPDESEPGFVDCTSTSKYYKISGNYQTKTDMFAGGYYAVASDGNFKQAGSAAVKLAPFRVYLGISDRTGAGTRAGAGIAAPENIILVIDGEEIGRAEEILAPEMIYDLMGRRVDNQSARGGMFIKNGKKIMVK